jgi:CIC family chloride channel protein
VKGIGAMVQSLLQSCHLFVRRHWQGFLAWRERFRFTEEALHLVMAGGIGVIGGVVNVVFVQIIVGFQHLVWKKQGANDLSPFQGSEWERLLAPVLGGIAAGLMLYLGLRWAGRKGSNNFLEAVSMGDGKLPFRSAVSQALSSMVSIISGATIGREGSITQFTSTLASKWGSLAKWHPYRVRLMVACGAASGMAAAYNAPIAGAVFAAHIVLGNFSMHLFAPLVFSSVIASMVSRSFFGMEPLYHASSEMTITLIQLPWFVILGIVCGLVGALFLKSMNWLRGLVQKMSMPLPLQLGLGGLAIGGVAYSFPQVLGNGYSGVNLILAHQMELTAVLALFALRWLATIVAVGSGAVGGVMTPTLFLGAALGGVFGLYTLQEQWHLGIPVGVFALVGMSGMLAATTHSPLLAMIMVFEISLNYNLMPALMIASAIATLVARQVHSSNIYTEALYARGMDGTWESDQVGEASRQRVGDLMRHPVPPLRDNCLFPDIADRFITCSFHFLPVVDDQNRLLGMVALSDLKEYLHMGEQLKSVIAYDIMRPAPKCLTPGQRLDEALPILLEAEMRNVPVVNNRREKRLVGAVNRAEALGQLAEAMTSRSVKGSVESSERK